MTAPATSGGTAVDTSVHAQAAISSIDAALGALGKVEGAVGSGQNRLTYAASLAQSQITNLAAAESQIRDADIAAQAATLSQVQILLEVSIAGMAQANSTPQAVLTLLRPQ